ncbi:MAG: TetR/AcrR family transcriptional regulator [Sciscionella sp.]
MPAPDTKPVRRKRMPRAERERQMLAVAEEVFAERGYVAASMDEIAERVGVSKPMLYEYFGSKEGLLVGAIRESRAELRAVTERAIDGVTDADEALRKGIMAFFDFITEHRQAWSLLRNESTLLAGSTAAEIEATRQQQTDLMITLFGHYLPNATPSEHEATAEIVVGACERLAIWCERRQDITPRQATEHIMRSLWYGLRDTSATELEVRH